MYKNMKKLVFGLMATMLLSCYSYGQTNPPTRHFVFVGCDEWGRASKKCAGWGLCNARWFYWEDSKNKAPGYPLEFDSNKNEYYINIILDEATKAKYPNENFDSIIVDNDIILNTKLLLV